MSDVAVYVVPFCWGLDLLTPLAKRVEGLVDTKFSDQDRLRRPVEHRVEEVHPGHLDAASRGGGRRNGAWSRPSVLRVPSWGWVWGIGV